MLKNMLHKMFGGKSPNELKCFQLKQMMSSMPPDFGEEEDLASVSRLGSYTLNRPQNGDAGKQKITIKIHNLKFDHDFSPMLHLFQCHSC